MNHSIFWGYYHNSSNIYITSLSDTIPKDYPSYPNHKQICDFLENRSNKYILEKSGGKFDFIFDLMGCFQYANDNNHRMQIIDRYKDLTKETGKIVIYSNTTLSSFLLENKTQIAQTKRTVNFFQIDNSKKVALIENTFEKYEDEKTFKDLEIIDASELDEDQ